MDVLPRIMPLGDNFRILRGDRISVVTEGRDVTAVGDVDDADVDNEGVGEVDNDNDVGEIGDREVGEDGFVGEDFLDPLPCFLSTLSLNE